MARWIILSRNVQEGFYGGTWQNGIWPWRMFRGLMEGELYVWVGKRSLREWQCVYWGILGEFKTWKRVDY